MFKSGLAAIVGSVIWFLVIRGVGIPADTPLFFKGAFLILDSLVAIVGVAGILLAIIGTKAGRSCAKDDDADSYLVGYGDDF